MNIFIGVGKICDVQVNGRIMKFNLAIKQEKPCNVPCVLFDPDDELRKSIEKFGTSKKIVWLKGRAATYEFESQGRTINKLEIVTYANSIKPV